MLGYKLWKSKTITGSVYIMDSGSIINGKDSGAFMEALWLLDGDTGI